MMYVGFYSGVHLRMAAVSEALVKAPRNANVFPAVSIYFHSSKIAFGLQNVCK